MYVVADYKQQRTFTHFPIRQQYCINGVYEDVRFPINACNQRNQMATSLPMVSLIWKRYVKCRRSVVYQVVSSVVITNFQKLLIQTRNRELPSTDLIERRKSGTHNMVCHQHFTGSHYNGTLLCKFQDNKVDIIYNIKGYRV